MSTFLPYSRQVIDEEDILAVTSALRSDYLTTGPAIESFEQAFAKSVDAQYAVAVSNGTAALHCAVIALAMQKGSLAITSPITFVASANAFLYEGHNVTFADIDAHSANMDPAALREVLRETPAQAIVPVHFAGQPCHMEEIAAIANSHKASIIEDAAHAVGSTYLNGRPVGCCQYSAMTTFSFHPVKNMTCGEGGIITTNDETLHRRLLQARSHGITRSANEFEITENAFDHGDARLPNPWYYEMQMLGYNYRLTDFQAALAESQLRKVPSFVKRRQEIVAFYRESLARLPFTSLLSEEYQAYSAYHLAVLRLQFTRLGKSRREVMRELSELGIGTQVHYIPVHLQPYYRHQFGFGRGDYPNAESFYDECLSIPVYPTMSDGDVSRVVDALYQVVAAPEQQQKAYSNGNSK